jgi:hypothetical protein
MFVRSILCNILININLTIIADKHATPNKEPYNTSLKIPIIITGIHPMNSGLCTIQKDKDITPNKGVISSLPLGMIGIKDTILKIKVNNTGNIL